MRIKTNDKKGLIYSRWDCRTCLLHVCNMTTICYCSDCQLSLMLWNRMEIKNNGFAFWIRYGGVYLILCSHLQTAIWNDALTFIWKMSTHVSHYIKMEVLIKYKVILEKFHHNILSCVYLDISIMSRYYQHIFTFTVSISCLSKKLYIILTILFKYRNVSRQPKQFVLSRNVLQVNK